MGYPAGLVCEERVLLLSNGLIAHLQSFIGRKTEQEHEALECGRAFKEHFEQNILDSSWDDRLVLACILWLGLWSGLINTTLHSLRDVHGLLLILAEKRITLTLNCEMLSRFRILCD